MDFPEDKVPFNPGCSHFHQHLDSKDCIPNHIFDPNPPAYYGTWNHLCGKNCANRVSVAQPGVASGLYAPTGPINICPAFCSSTIMTGVTADAYITLKINFKFTNEQFNKSVDIIPGRIYTITYLEDGNLKKCSGRVKNIFKVNSLENDTIYKIKIDCSSDYSNSVVVMKSDQIRNVVQYQKYAEEESTINESFHRGGTTAAEIIKDAVIINATLDANNNIIDGKIVSGTITNGSTVDGVAEGYNSSNHRINVVHGTTNGGILQKGNIVYGIVRSGDVDGIKDNTTGITEHAKVKGIITNAVIVNSEVIGGTTKNGTIINTTINNSTVKDAKVTGSDMITVGGVTIGNITTNGTTTGGSATGGYAIGTIDGVQYVITDGETTGNLTTTGGVLVGGEIVGGTKLGNMTINAVIKGGTVTGGVTVGGTTTNGTLSPIKAASMPVTSIVNAQNESVHYSRGTDHHKYHEQFQKALDEQTTKISDEINKLRDELDDNPGYVGDDNVTQPEIDSLFHS